MLIQNLPLKDDMEENKTVYGCIIHLFSQNNAVVSLSILCYAENFRQGVVGYNSSEALYYHSG